MKKDKHITGYDYSSREAREETVAALFARAKNARAGVENLWGRYNDYYNGLHHAMAETKEYCETNGIPWTPAVVPDAWIAVESQVDPNLPEPQFKGRDDDMDSEKAKKREFAVRYIVDNNRLKDMVTRNERRLLKYGDAFWKCFWDTGMMCGMNEGDIRIKDIPVDAMFPDPSVRDGDIQDGQFLEYVYRIHKVQFCQIYGRDLRKLGIEPEEILNADYKQDNIFDLTTTVDDQDDTVQILEHWFKQPEETKVKGKTVPAGSVGCVILAGGRELRYIPDYWEKTHKQCRLFPFVHYWRIGDENQVWNKSELFSIMDLIDAADRKMSMSLMNEAFLSNDIILMEEGALADGEELTNEPGTVVKVKPGKMGAVARLGGVQSLSNNAGGMEWLKNQIERANRNYDSSHGAETSHNTTATQLAMMRSDSNAQSDIKTADRNAGFERMYELLDWLALEYFDDDRMLFLGADPNAGREINIAMMFNSNEMGTDVPPIFDMNGEMVREEWTYFPKVDVTITAGDSVVRGKQATLQALQALTASQITADNWKLFAAQLEILDIPEKQSIIADWEKRFEMQQMQPEMQGAPAGAPEQTVMEPELLGAMRAAETAGGM